MEDTHKKHEKHLHEKPKDMMKAAKKPAKMMKKDCK